MQLGLLAHQLALAGFQRRALLRLEGPEAVQKIGQGGGSRDDGAFQRGSNRSGDLIELPVNLGCLGNQLIVHNHAQLIRPVDGFANAGLTLVFLLPLGSMRNTDFTTREPSGLRGP